jgi:hypothetical protein
MTRSTTIRLPGTDGPDITVERGAFSAPRVTIDGQVIARDPERKDSYPIVAADGKARSIVLKPGWNGMVVVADDGSRISLDPPRPLWETVLTFLPIGLVAVGGLIGGAFGGAAAATNIAISRTDLRTPVRIAAMVAVGAVAALGWFAVARTVATTLNPIPTYVTGQCLDGTGTGDAADSSAITTTACANQHGGEVIGIHTVPAPGDGAGYPGLSALQAIANAECLPLFAAYVGVAYDVSRLEMITLHPTKDAWDRADRQIACIAIGPGGDVLTGSVAGTAQ